MKKNNLMVTVSGGRSSAMMARHIQTSEKYKDFNKTYVFANTGQERKETIDFLKNIKNIWEIPLVMIEGVYSDKLGEGVTFKIVDFDNINMDSKPFENAIMHKNKGVYDGLPNSEAPYCSEMLKTLPCKKYCDSIYGVNKYIKAIGYRLEDMPKRITATEIKLDEKRIFPLLTDFDEIIGTKHLNEFWNKQDFKLKIHSKFGNCQLCWKKSEHNLVDTIRFGTDAVPFWKRMEKLYSNTSFRDRKSIKDLIELSKLPYTPELNFDYPDYSCVCNF